MPRQLSEFGWQAPSRLHSCLTQTCPQSEHQSSWSNPSRINCLPSEVFPQGKCCFFAIVYGHQPIVHTWPEFDGLLVDYTKERNKLETCHSSASLVTLPVEVVDSGPDPGGSELVAGGIELHSAQHAHFYSELELVLPAFHSQQLGLLFRELGLQVEDVFVEGEGDKLFTSWHLNFAATFFQLLSGTTLRPFPAPHPLSVSSLSKTQLNIPEHLIVVSITLY